MNLNELAQEVHAENLKWWQNIDTGEPINRNKFELLALAVSEISEGLEGERKNLMDDKLPHRKMAEVEMADAYIRLLDFAAGFGLHLSEYETTAMSPEADNKGEGLFCLMRTICDIGRADYPQWSISMALGYIRQYCVKWGYDLDGAMTEKRAFNSTREDHTHEARRIAGGKQF